MCEMTEMIDSYKESAKKIQKRITELHAIIAENSKTGDGAHLQKLVERRYLLYTELWDIERALRSMMEYAQCVSERMEREKIA